MLEKELLKDGPLFGDFENVPWLISPKWFQLTEKEIGELQRLGLTLFSFLKCYHDLYYLDERAAKLVEYGKPNEVVKLQRKITKDLPLLIRADIVPTENGPKVTEIETIVTLRKHKNVHGAVDSIRVPVALYL